MATASELNQFRRLIGDYGRDSVDDSDIETYLDDAVRELTADFTTPVADFDSLYIQYKPEVIVYAAINYWWNIAAKLVDHHSQTTGQSSHNASEKWDRAMEMIRTLREQYATIQQLGTDITQGNLSRFSKATLSRWGGVREEDAL